MVLQLELLAFSILFVFQAYHHLEMRKSFTLVEKRFDKMADELGETSAISAAGVKPSLAILMAAGSGDMIAAFIGTDTA
ncbi:hypothetical protein B0H19DRAFT_390140 [Mycena capillaripes]|nr:hypothetical protein B0H19DRAFT_390140 [Mycena capillaripes]